MKHPSYRVTSKSRPKLVDFVATQLGISKKKAKLIIDSRCVFVNQKRIWMSKHELKTGDVVEIQTTPGSQSRAFKILYQDKHYLIVNKPCGLATNGKGSLEEAVRKTTGQQTIQAAHRLDTGTSGCILFSKSKETKDAMLPLFRDHKVVKTYRGLVHGRMEKKASFVRNPIDGKSALTEYEVLSSNEEASYLRARIATGRTHQIRKHFASISHPVLGDRTYGPKKVFSEQLRTIPRQMLHADRLTFTSPMNGVEVSCKAPLPKDFRDCLKVLRLR